MLIRWLCYLAALTVAAGGQLFYNGYLVHLAFLVVLLLPWLSLILSLAPMILLRCELLPPAAEVLRGGEAHWTVELSNPTGLPLSRIWVTCRVTDLNEPETRGERQRFRCSGVSRDDMISLSVDTGHCGTLSCRVEGLWVWDALGLFAIPRPCPAPVEVQVSPRLTDGDVLRSWGGRLNETQGTRPARSGMGQDYDLRSYRPGDPMRMVHWKLSSKQDDLVVREPLEAPWPTAVLTFDHFGPRDGLDLRLELLRTASQTLLDQGRTHYIQWRHPESGQLRSFAVSDRESCRACLSAALRDPMPVEGQSILDLPPRLAGLPGPLFQIHLDETEGGAQG